MTDVVEAVTKKTLILKSGVRLEVLDTLKAVEVHRWDQRLKDQDYEDLIKYISNNKDLEDVRYVEVR